MPQKQNRVLEKQNYKETLRSLVQTKTSEPLNLSKSKEQKRTVLYQKTNNLKQQHASSAGLEPRPRGRRCRQRWSLGHCSSQRIVVEEASSATAGAFSCTLASFTRALDGLFCCEGGARAPRELVGSRQLRSIVAAIYSGHRACSCDA